ASTAVCLKSEPKSINRRATKTRRAQGGRATTTKAQTTGATATGSVKSHVPPYAGRASSQRIAAGIPTLVRHQYLPSSTNPAAVARPAGPCSVTLGPPRASGALWQEELP